MEGCLRALATWTEMRVHFVHWHVQDTVVMLEEGNLPPPTVFPVQHAGPQEGAQWALSGDRAVLEGGGAEAETAGRDGEAGKLGAGVPCLRENDRGGVGVLLPRAAPHGNGR